MPAPRSQLRPLVSVALLLSLVPAAAGAQDRPSDCTAQLAAMDRTFVEAMARVLTTGGGPPGEQCAALANQMDVIAKERELHVRCLPPGDQLDGVLAMLNGSAVDFRQAQAQLGCNVTAAAR
jgi:hypothetical protein